MLFFNIITLILGQDVSYGILVRNTKLFEVFGPVIKSNSMHLQTIVASYLYSSESASEVDLFQKMFDDNYVFLCIAVLSVLFIGLFIEAYRNRHIIARIGNGMLGREAKNRSETKDSASPFVQDM